MNEPPALPPLREIIKTFGLGAKKSLGQHFLLDTNLTGRIARAAGLLNNKHVVEIGPGPDLHDVFVVEQPGGACDSACQIGVQQEVLPQ